MTSIQTVHETIADRLRQAIIDGELRPGDRLLQDELATRYGVSRIPVREVLRTLAAEGLVTFNERHGVIVTELTAEDIEEIYSIRMSLEAMATRLAAQRITPEQLEELRQAMNELEAASSEPGHYFQLNYEFHAIILDAARRPRLKTMITNLRNCAEPAARRYLDPAGRVGIAHEDHRALYEALARHDAEAAERLAAAHGEHIMRGILADMNGRASDAAG